MRLANPVPTDDSVDLTPMIDVVFLLIIFFMVVASAITQKIEIEVPAAEEAIVPDDTGIRTTITVDGEGNFYIGLREVTLEELQEEVTLNNQTIEGYKVFIRGDAETEHQHVRKVMQACAESGVFNVIFATLQEG